MANPETSGQRLVPEMGCVLEGERRTFNTVFAAFVNRLYLTKRALEEGVRQDDLRIEMEKWLHQTKEKVGEEELRLMHHFWMIFEDMVSPPLPRIVYSSPTEPLPAPEFVVAFGGAIANGKSVLSRFLAERFNATNISECYHQDENPFLAPAYTHPGYMFRAQLRFLADNIWMGMSISDKTGRWSWETCPWSDRNFMEWRWRVGIINEEEHKMYQKLFDLLEPIIMKPDLLVMLRPSSQDRLWEGLQARIEANPEERRMERGITKADLATLCQVCDESVEPLRQKGIRVLVREIDPVEIWEKREPRYAFEYHVREELEMLSELLTRDPREVANKIIVLLARSREAQVVIVHSKSMFAGKTSVLNFIAESIGSEFVQAFQPRAAIRYGDRHVINMIDRDGRSIPAITIESNRLEEINRLIDEQGITPQQKPIIFIDEVMLFHESDAVGAIKTIEELRERGFCVIADGIDYTFKREPFTFIHELIRKSLMDDRWHQYEMGTTCKDCGKSAYFSRRLTPDGRIADKDDSNYQAGDHYEAVCPDHLSCLGLPEGFVWIKLPTEM